MRFGPRLAAYSAGYKLGRLLGFPRLVPVNITASVTFRCNSRCKTCNVWKKKPNASQELSLEEYEKIFRSLKTVPAWFTMSGGEPYLRRDLPEICESAAGCRPQIINIPTNGLLTKTIADQTARILELCKDVKIVINLSLDGIGEKHDQIRGVKGNFDKALATYKLLKELKRDHSNLTLGVHTVISNLNINDLPETYEYVMENLKPDSYITEVAEERVELETMGAGITPSADQYAKAIDYLVGQMRHNKKSGFPGLIQGLREKYYYLAVRTLREKRQVIPCYAGWASAHIDPFGDVWTCAILAKPVGNLRKTNYDFRKAWFSEEANRLRRSIRAGKCHCPLANAQYTNMLCNYGFLLRNTFKRGQA